MGHDDTLARSYLVNPNGISRAFERGAFIIWLQGCGWSLPWSCEQERLPDDPISAWNVLWSTGTLSKKLQFVICIIHIINKISHCLTDIDKCNRYIYLHAPMKLLATPEVSIWRDLGSIKMISCLLLVFWGVQCDQISNIIGCICSVASRDSWE